MSQKRLSFFFFPFSLEMCGSFGPHALAYISFPVLHALETTSMNVSLSSKGQLADPTSKSFGFESALGNGSLSSTCWSLHIGDPFGVHINHVVSETFDNVRSGFFLDISKKDIDLSLLRRGTREVLPEKTDDRTSVLPSPLTTGTPIEKVSSNENIKKTENRSFNGVKTIETHAQTHVHRTPPEPKHIDPEDRSEDSGTSRGTRADIPATASLSKTSSDAYIDSRAVSAPTISDPVSVPTIATAPTAVAASASNPAPTEKWAASAGTLSVIVKEEFFAQFRSGLCASSTLRGTLSAAVSGSNAGLALVVFSVTDGCCALDTNKQLCQLQQQAEQTSRRALRLDLDLLLRYHSARGGAPAPMLRYTNAESFKPTAILKASCTSKLSGSKMLLTVSLQLHPSLKQQDADGKNIAGLVVRVSLAPLERLTKVLSARFRPEQSGEISGEGGARVLVWQNVENLLFAANTEIPSVRLEGMLELSGSVQLPAASPLPIAVTGRLKDRLLSSMNPGVQLPRGSSVQSLPLDLCTLFELRYL
jgi:hypothetical protein